MGKRSIETLVGFFVLLGLAGLVFLAMKAANLGSVGGGDTYTLKANFDNIGGLKVRAPVRTAGVTVGRVTGGRKTLLIRPRIIALILNQVVRDR